MRDAGIIFEPGPPRRPRRTLLWAARLAFVAAQAVIWWGVFSTGGAEVGVDTLLPWDKSQHFIAFLGLMLLALPAFPGLSVTTLALALAADGGLIELIQATPLVGRDADIWDWVADVAGILTVVAALIAWHLRLRLRQKAKSEVTLGSR